MAFAYTVDEPMATGKMKKTQNIKQNVIRLTGTFTFTPATVKGTIDLTDTTKSGIYKAATKVSAYDVLITSGTVSDQLTSGPNMDEDGVAAAGKIGILASANDIVGTWWADVVI
jgi:hypothetical protein